MTQTWADLLFAHWPVEAAQLRPLIPAGLEVDTYAGQAWLGVVPFAMRRVYPRWTLPVPGLSDFLELNVRTYVRAGNRPGVYFFSLDASNRAAVTIARAWYRLPYYDAHMRLAEAPDGWIHYHSRRTHAGAPAAEFKGRYRPAGPVRLSRRGSLEEWLTERYCLYTLGSGGALCRGEIQHPLWPLQPAEAEIEVNTLAAAAGVALPPGPPHLLFARELETLEWSVRPV